MISNEGLNDLDLLYHCQCIQREVREIRIMIDEIVRPKQSPDILSRAIRDEPATEAMIRGVTPINGPVELSGGGIKIIKKDREIIKNPVTVMDQIQTSDQGIGPEFLHRDYVPEFFSQGWTNEDLQRVIDAGRILVIL